MSEQDRATLLHNVLHIDLRYRRRAGEEPGEEDYTSRFPQYADVITEEFQQSTQEMLSVAVDTVSFSPRLRQLEMPTVVRLGDYVLERELGRGAMGIVFAARHLRHGTLVAFKAGGWHCQRRRLGQNAFHLLAPKPFHFISTGATGVSPVPLNHPGIIRRSQDKQAGWHSVNPG